MLRVIFSCLATTIFCFSMHAQKLGCAFHSHFEETPVVNRYGFPREKIEAEQFVKKCYETLGVPFINVQVKLIIGFNNCAALSSPYGDSLFVDPNWIDGLRRKDDWFHLFVVGHEIGHLLFKHQNSEDQVKQELEADRIGGLLLAKFGFPFKSLAEVYPTELFTTIETTHPKTVDRIMAADYVLKKSKEIHLRQILGTTKFSILRELTPRDKLLKEYQDLEDRFINTNKADDLEECLEILSTTYRNSEFRTIAKNNIIKILMYAMQYNVIDQVRCLGILERLYLKTSDPIFILYKSFNFTAPEHKNNDIIKKEDVQAIMQIDANNLDDEEYITYSAYIFSAIIQGLVSENLLYDMEMRLTKIAKGEPPSDVAGHNALFVQAQYTGNYQSALTHAKSALFSARKWYSDHKYESAALSNWYYTNYIVSSQNYCLALLRLGHYQEIISIADNMLSDKKPISFPTDKGKIMDSEFLYYLIRSHFELKQYDKIPDLYYKLEQFHREDKIILHCTGISLIRLNRKNEGEKFLTKACQSGNNNSCFYLKL